MPLMSSAALNRSNDNQALLTCSTPDPAAGTALSADPASGPTSIGPSSPVPRQRQLQHRSPSILRQRRNPLSSPTHLVPLIINGKRHTSGGFAAGDSISATVNSTEVTYQVIVDDLTVNGDGNGGKPQSNKRVTTSPAAYCCHRCRWRPQWCGHCQR